MVVLCLSVTFGSSSFAGAQTPSRSLTIHNVTLQEATGTLTIVGVGFGRAPVVTVDGQPVRVLLGATDMQLDVEAPSAIWTAPGTYRLTVSDAARKASDTFVVASQMGVAVATGSVGSRVSGGDPGAPTLATTRHAAARTSGGGGARSSGTVSAMLIDNTSNTALGSAALAVNTTGYYNAALGVNALNHNTAGIHNTALGAWSLYSNTTGEFNTASGQDALWSNSTGSRNTASGKAALYANSVGSDNAAFGYYALTANVGSLNTAAGSEALRSNTMGDRNSAVGFAALHFNTTGSINTASGA
jgi:hypothetical protein